MQGIISFITARTSRIITFGCIYLLVSILLIFYYNFKPPVRLKDYYFSEITYQKVYFKETADNIIIVSDAKEYRLPIGYLNWQSKTDLAEALRKLSSTTKAEVWLENKETESPLVKGIKTDSFYFSPEVGIDIDNKHNKSMAELFFWFLIGAIVVIVVGVIKFFCR